MQVRTNITTFATFPKVTDLKQPFWLDFGNNPIANIFETFYIIILVNKMQEVTILLFNSLLHYFLNDFKEAYFLRTMVIAFFNSQMQIFSIKMIIQQKLKNR